MWDRSQSHNSIGVNINMGMFTFYKRLMVKGGGLFGTGSPISCQETDSTVEKMVKTGLL